MKPTDEYKPDLVFVDGPVRDLTARRYGEPSAHSQMMIEYYSARDAWLNRREDAALGYKTEELEFAEADPRPLLKEFMIHGRKN